MHAHKRDALLCIGELGDKIIGGGVSSCLVSVVHLMTEGGRLEIEGHCRVIRFYCRELARYDIDHAVYRVGGLAALGGKWTHTVICAVDYTVSVNDEYFLHKSSPLLICKVDFGTVAAEVAAIVNVGGDHDDHIGLFSHGGHYIAAISVEPDGRIAILDPSYKEDKFDEDGRMGKVEMKNGVIALCAPEVLAADCTNRSTPYNLFWRK